MVNENKPVIVIEDGTSKMLEIKEKKVNEGTIVTTTERYVVIKFDFTDKSLKDEGDLLDYLKENSIQYKFVEVVEVVELGE